MAFLKQRNTTPPDGFCYIQMETKTWIYGDFLRELVDRVMEHRAYKGITPADRESVERDVQRQMCDGLTKSECQPEPGEKYQPYVDMSRSLSLTKVVSFTESMFQHMKDGFELVDKAEAYRRAEICRGCKFNKMAGACVCTPFFKLVDALTPADRKEPGLSLCTICGCSLQAKVLMPDDVITAPSETVGLRMPDYCWITPLLKEAHARKTQEAAID